MRNMIFATYQGMKQIVSKKTGEIYQVIVLRDYESFIELELWPKRDDFVLESDVKIGDDVVVEGVMSSKGITNVVRIKKDKAETKAS